MAAVGGGSGGGRAPGRDTGGSQPRRRRPPKRVLLYLGGFARCFHGLIFISILTTLSSRSLRKLSAANAAVPLRRPGFGLPNGAAPPGRGLALGEPGLVKHLQKEPWASPAGL